MYFHNPSKPQPNTGRIKLQRADQAPRDPLFVSLHAITRDDSGSREDEIRTERLDYCGRKH